MDSSNPSGSKPHKTIAMALTGKRSENRKKTSNSNKNGDSTSPVSKPQKTIEMALSGKHSENREKTSNLNKDENSISSVPKPQKTIQMALMGKHSGDKIKKLNPSSGAKSDLLQHQQKSPSKQNKHRLSVKAAPNKQALPDNGQSVPDTATDLMSQDEALEIIKNFKRNNKSTMNACYQLAARKGFEALGYKSFKEGIEKKNLGIGYAYAHRLKTAGEIHMIICPGISIGDIAEGVLRVLHCYSDEDKKQIWDKAVDKCSDVAKIKKTLLENIIAEGGFEKKSVKKNEVNHEISSILVKKLKKVSFDLVKEHNSPKKGEKPVSKSHFDKTLQLVFNEVRNHISERYTTLCDG